MVTLDADGAILGRIASDVAKRLLNGEEVTVVNARKAVITGDKRATLQEYKERAERGHRYKGPFYPKAPERIFKRAVRGMLPWKKPRGREAYKRLKVHAGAPEGVEGGETPEHAALAKSGATKFVRLEEVSHSLGWRPNV